MIAKVEYTSRRDVERRTACSRTILLSIRGIDERPPRLASGWVDVLPMTFDDVVPGEGFGCEEPMSEEQAKEIRAWIGGWSASPHTVKLLIHCNAGVSRSAAVALWARQVLGCPVAGVEGDGRDANPHVMARLADAPLPR